MSHRLQVFSPWASCLAAVLGVTGCVAGEADSPSQATVTFPAWNSSANQNQSLTVVPADGWTIARVDYAVDEGEWKQATPGADGTYGLTLTDLDIGASEVAVRVTSTYRDQTQTDIFYNTIPNVAAVFNCTSQDAMLPSSTLYFDNVNEVRTLSGYFGDPDAGHNVSFIIDFNDDLGDHFQNVAKIVDRGRTFITAEFDVSQARCALGRDAQNRCVDCTLEYKLGVQVDGVEVCPLATYGKVQRYCGGRF